MTSRLYIQLGKAGDILNLLPLLYLDAKSGNRAGLMVAKEYAGILEGCSYVEPVIFDGPPWELARANDEAKRLTEDVVCCQVNGPPELVAEYSYGPKSLPHATTESFQKEAWKIAGRLTEWRNQPPLVFDRRNTSREINLVSRLSHKKIILVSCSGATSPFPYRELLFELLHLKFKKGYEVVDLSTFKAERIYDLLAVYEHAHCLVADDSAPLHLAHACKTLPVVALVNDRPLLWHGSCWRPNHIAHIRYRDFPKRAVGMLDAIQDIGTAGDWFKAKSQPPAIVHVWSAYEAAASNEDRRLSAAESWTEAYSQSGHWVASCIESGVIGRDSQHSQIADSKRFPFVKDVLSLACLRAGDDDLICLTRCDTSFQPGLTETLLKASPCFAHRRLIHPDTYHPAVDLFCFSKSWWRAHGEEYPSGLVMGQDPYWHRALMELVKKHGGQELKGVVFRAHSKAVARNGAVPKYIAHNDVLAKAWLDKNSIVSAVPPVQEQLPCAPLNRLALHPFGYNPSLIRFNGKLLMAYRWHDEGNASTTLAMAELDEQFNVTANRPIAMPQDKYASHEDPRLFVFQGALHMSYVCSTWPESPPKAVVRYGRLEDGSPWNIRDAIQPDHGQNHGIGLEKNWVFFAHGSDLCYFYHSDECIGPFPQSVGGQPLRWPWGLVRGGTTPLPYGDKLISFFHSRLDNEPAPFFWRYAVGARILNAQPPFATVAVSREPILRGSEADALSATEKSACHHHKPNVVFPAGAIDHDGGWLVSVGINDSLCALVKVSEKDLRL